MTFSVIYQLSVKICFIQRPSVCGTTLLFCDIKNNNFTTSQKYSIKSKVLDTAFISYKLFKSKRRVSSLSKAKLNALENLTKNKDTKNR